ncbi:carbon monoxide dehydrogenase [Bordetella genomosp. 9]|uniref:FAD binding domain-containing protein n=1 Tax=Bordetella genomosp. 9 TaxID=1416803 RepID=UPI000A28F3F8|nr:FAD binding domain-containing protein [Bordetella genomosp. 9]ARP90762.1 carbon monoxide dehydrogenase [Bordetella genomosp. 9]
MKAAKFDYIRATSVAHALSALRDHDGRAKLMAGGQSLGPMLNLRLARPAAVVDISGIDALRAVTREGDSVRVGAAVTHAEIEDGIHAPLRESPLRRVAAGIAYRAVRNRGTLGGSLAHADPAADWVVAMAALGARIEIAGGAGVRQVDADVWMQGAYTTEIGEDELIQAVHVPAGSEHARWGYYKFCRKTGEFAEASCAAWFDPRSGTARIALGALDGAPRLLMALAGRVARDAGAALDADAIAAEVARAMPDKDEAHRQLHVAAVQRCLAQAVGRGQAQ